MLKRFLISPAGIVFLLLFQIVPLILFPLESFSPKTQEWWLPVLLVAMVVVADFELIARRTANTGPWDLISFAHGFNIISRLMMVWPHVMRTENGVSAINVPYTSLTILAMLLSTYYLIYTEKPQVRNGLLRS